MTLMCLTLLLVWVAAGAEGEPLSLPVDDSPGLPFDRTIDFNITTYDDPTIHVDWNRVNNRDTPYNCNYYWAKIRIGHPSQLRTASWDGWTSYNKARADVIAKKVNAIIAINGDFYGAHADGFVMRQGVVYRDNMVRKQDILLIDEEGDFHIIPFDADTDAIDKTHWEGRKVVNALTFGPALIVNDEVVLNHDADPAYADAPGRGYRTCIAQTGHLEYLLLTCKDVGCTLEEMCSLVDDLTDHVDVAYILDGGNVSQFVYLGRLMNKLAKEARPVTDIVYFATACPDWVNQ